MQQPREACHPPRFPELFFLDVPVNGLLFHLWKRFQSFLSASLEKRRLRLPDIVRNIFDFLRFLSEQKTWRLEKFSNRDFLRWEKDAELFYASEREKNKQNSSLIRNLLLNSNAQDFWFCETQFCAEKDLNRNLVTQEGAKILFPLKKHLQKPFPQYSIKATKRNLRFFHFL